METFAKNMVFFIDCTPVQNSISLSSLVYISPNGDQSSQIPRQWTELHQIAISAQTADISLCHVKS